MRLYAVSKQFFLLLWLPQTAAANHNTHPKRHSLARTHTPHPLPLTHTHTPATHPQQAEALSFLALLSPAQSLRWLRSLLINTQLISVCLSWRWRRVLLPFVRGPPFLCSTALLPTPLPAAGNNYLRNVIIIIFF